MHRSTMLMTFAAASLGLSLSAALIAQPSEAPATDEAAKPADDPLAPASAAAPAQAGDAVPATPAEPAASAANGTAAAKADAPDGAEKAKDKEEKKGPQPE